MINKLRIITQLFLLSFILKNESFSTSSNNNNSRKENPKRSVFNSYNNFNYFVLEHNNISHHIEYRENNFNQFHINNRCISHQNQIAQQHRPTYINNLPTHQNRYYSNTQNTYYLPSWGQHITSSQNFASYHFIHHQTYTSSIDINSSNTHNKSFCKKPKSKKSFAVKNKEIITSKNNSSDDLFLAFNIAYAIIYPNKN